METADGTHFTTGRITLGTEATTDAALSVVYGALADSGFEVRLAGPGKVTVFGPKGQSVKSIKFDADAWTPVTKRIVGVPTMK